MLDDVESVANPEGACFDGKLNISVVVIPGIAGVVALAEVELRELAQHSVYDSVVAYNRTRLVLLLHEVHSHTQLPVQFAYSPDYRLVLFV